MLFLPNNVYIFFWGEGWNLSDHSSTCGVYACEKSRRLFNLDYIGNSLWSPCVLQNKGRLIVIIFYGQFLHFLLLIQTTESLNPPPTHPPAPTHNPLNCSSSWHIGFKKEICYIFIIPCKRSE